MEVLYEIFLKNMPELVHLVAEHNISAKSPDLMNSSLDLEHYFLLKHHGLVEGI